MADETSKNYVLNLDVNMTKLLKTMALAEKSAQSLDAKFKQIGGNASKSLGKSTGSFQETSKVVDGTTGKMASLGKETSKATKVMRDQNGTLGTLTKTTKRMKDGTTQVTTAFKQASTSSDSFIQRLGMLAKRAVGVVLVWTALRSIMMNTTRLFKSSIKFLIEWEYQLAQVAIVGNSTKESLSTLSGALIQIGKDFGVSYKDLGEASKLWRQQGRAMEEIIPLMRTTAKLSLLTGQTTSESVENLTAVLKAYRIEAKNSINIIDSMTNIMLKHAITAGDLSSAYKQVASTASSLGISFSELSGYITAIKAVTRDSGSKIGLSLRTMFSRITTSSAEAIQNLSSVPLYLDNTGKSTFAVTPRMRALGDIISELSLKFGSLGNAQKSQLATLIGGVRRQNQVFALFDNFTESVEAQTDALFGLGKSSDAIKILTDTAKVGIDQLKNSWFSFVESIANSSVIKSVVNGLTKAIGALDKVLAPNKFAYKASLDLLNDQNDEYAQQIQLADGVGQVLIKAKQIQQQSLRANKEQNDVLVARAKILTHALNEALKTQGIKINISENLGFDDLIGSLDDLDKKMKELKIDALVGQQVAKIKTEILSAGQTIGAFRKEFEKVAHTRVSGLSNVGSLVGNQSDQAIASLKKIEKGLKLSDDEANNLVVTYKKLNNMNDVFGKGLKKNHKEIAEKEVALEGLVEGYIAQNETLSDGAKIREDVITKMQNELDTVQKIELIYKKQDIINKAILSDQLERLKNAGALGSEILKQKDALQKQLNIEESLASKIQDQLKYQRELTKEKRLQGELGSESVRLFEIARDSGTDVARKISDVLSGDVDFSSFVRQGGEAVDIFKDKFSSVFKEQQAQQFFRGDTVSGEKGLRGGTSFNIKETEFGKSQSYLRRQSARDAERNQRILFAQEQAVITPKTTITAPIKVDFITYINVSELSELVGLVITGISKQLPQAGTVINKALKSALYNKQTGSL